MLFTLGVVFVFALGGLTGLYLATISTDLYLHDTMFVVGHFHLTMAAATFLAIFAAHLLLVPQDVRAAAGRAPGQVALLAVGGVHHPGVLRAAAGRATPASRAAVGSAPVPVPEAPGPGQPWTSYFAFALAASQLLFVWNFFANVFRKADAPANPWQVGHAGVDRPLAAAAPQLRRHPHGACAARTSCRTPRCEKRLGRDWIAQDEVLP